MATKDITDNQVVRACWEFREKGFTSAHEYLVEITGENKKACLRAMQRSCGRGLIDYGVSLQAAWVTEKGKLYLEPRD